MFSCKISSVTIKRHAFRLKVVVESATGGIILLSVRACGSDVVVTKSESRMGTFQSLGCREKFNTQHVNFLT